MARLARIVIPNLPHHVTQRGNRRQTVFFGEDDYAAYHGPGSGDTISNWHLTDANSNPTSYSYDGLDRLGTASYPDTSTEAYTYDADSNILTRKTRKGDTITLTYDTLNRLSTKTPPSPAAVVSYRYDQAGHVIGVSDTSAAITVPSTAASYVATASYDALNRLFLTSWSPAPIHTTTTTYDVFGRATKVTYPDGSMTTSTFGLCTPGSGSGDTFRDQGTLYLSPCARWLCRRPTAPHAAWSAGRTVGGTKRCVLRESAILFRRPYPSVRDRPRSQFSVIALTLPKTHNTDTARFP